MIRSNIDRSWQRVEAAPHRDAGVVYHHVDAAERVHGFGHEPFAVLLVGDVGGQRARFAAARAAFLRQRSRGAPGRAPPAPGARRGAASASASARPMPSEAPVRMILQFRDLGHVSQGSRLHSARLTSYGGWRRANAWAGCCDRFFKLWVRAAVQPAEAPPSLTAPRVPVCYVLETRFGGRPRRAVQCHRARQGCRIPKSAPAACPSKSAAPTSTSGRRRRFWDATRHAPAAAAPAGAGRGAARRFGARRPAGADRGVLGPRAAEGRLVAAPAVRGELGADHARAQILRGARQRPQRHGGDGRAHSACARCSTPRPRTTRRGASRASCAASCAASAPSRIGPDLSHRRTIVARVLRARAVRAVVAAEAREKHDDYRPGLLQARKYAFEIAANYSHAFVQIAEKLLGRVWNRVYDGVKFNHAGDAQGGLRRQRSGLRALPPQPHGLPAAVVRDLPPGLRAAAHRRGHQPQHAGGRALPAQGRRVLHPPQLRAATRCTPWCS